MRYKQQGMTLIGTVLMLAALGFVGLLGMRLVPVYLQHYSVVDSMQSMQAYARENPDDFRQLTQIEVKQILMKRLYINQITNITEKDIAVNRTSHGFDIDVAYQVQVKLFANIDALIKFNPSVMLSNGS